MILTLGIKCHWRRLRIKGRPVDIPHVPNGHHVICCIRHREKKKKEVTAICDSLEQMQTLYDLYADKAVISWHHTGVFVVPMQSRQ